MPVRRYRSFEEIPAPPLHARGTADLFRAIAATWSAAQSLAPLRFPPGVFRHRSLGDLNAQTDAWSRENIRALARQRRPVGT